MVALGVGLAQVIEQPPPLAYHFQQPAPRAVVLHVFLQVLRQLVDPSRQQRNLHVRRPGVALVDAEP